jgi:hypothetical protein
MGEQLGNATESRRGEGVDCRCCLEENLNVLVAHNVRFVENCNNDRGESVTTEGDKCLEDRIASPFRRSKRRGGNHRGELPAKRGRKERLVETNIP